MSANHPWIVSRAVNGRSLLSRKPVRFRICVGVSFRLECSERARSDIFMATKCFSWAFDRLYRYHKKAEAVQKQKERFTKDSLFSPAYSSECPQILEWKIPIPCLSWEEHFMHHLY